MKLENIFPACFSCLDARQLEKLKDEIRRIRTPESFPAIIEKLQQSSAFPPYLKDLAHLELALYMCRENYVALPETINKIAQNPTLQLLKCGWRNLLSLLPENKFPQGIEVTPGENYVLVYFPPGSDRLVKKLASAEDLLALKIVVEQIQPELAAAEGGVTVGVINQILNNAIREGILIGPSSGIRRNPLAFPRGENIGEEYFFSPFFTLQWHITQTCDLHCRHCYDRSDRAALPFANGLAILDDLRDFCREHYVQGQVSFSGGNPLLYPHFLELYQAAAERGLITAILGNPAPRTIIQKIVDIRKPEFYQVSLEGMPDHNDYIRGKGHFDRVMNFLELLQELGIYSMVMLTLTRDNMNEVLPLAEMLRGKADIFTFNRLAMVGEGAGLQSVNQDEYSAFLEKYLAAARNNPCMACKDNLINIIHHQHNEPLFGGCAGHGCGAAFNFFAVLPDGEAHACRKFPSLIGNVFKQSISEIYHGELAAKYRAGSAACSTCSIRPVCGGCPAVVYGFGLDVFTDKDPYCFFQKPPSAGNSKR